MAPNNCSNCGAPYSAIQKNIGYATDDGSIECYSCDHKVWDNPIPVAVCVQPVYHTFDDGYTRHGLAIAKRAIEPKLGTWCLFGGHIANGETIEEGAAREWLEETGLHAIEEDVRITGSYANGKGHVLIAVERPAITLDAYINATLCPENSAISVMWDEDQVLGFPIHTTIAHKWFMEEKPSEFMMTDDTRADADEMLASIRDRSDTLPADDDD